MKYYYLQAHDKHARIRRIQLAAIAAGVVIAACILLLIAAGTKKNMNDQAAKNNGPKAVMLDTNATDLRQANCQSKAKKHSAIERSSVSQLRKLAEYETACDSSVTDTVSFFTALPTTSNEAVDQATDVAETLKEYARHGITPVVFLEPNTPSGNVADFTAYQSGSYDPILELFFSNLRSQGITDKQMGMWVPLPEWNIPAWGNTEPALFVDLFTRTAQMQKHFFPGSQVSVMLESKTYIHGSWEASSYSSLLPYVQGIPKGLVDSFGLQGFPWGAQDSGEVAITDPKVYLRADLAMEAAHALGVKHIWFNTGTFRYFAKSTSKPTTLSPLQRQQDLSGVINIAQEVKQAGFQSAIHLFARDKSNTDEKIDWSYWSPGGVKNSPYTVVFQTFVHDVRAAGVSLWLYDNDGKD